MRRVHGHVTFKNVAAVKRDASSEVEREPEDKAALVKQSILGDSTAVQAFVLRESRQGIARHPAKPKPLQVIGKGP